MIRGGMKGAIIVRIRPTRITPKKEMMLHQIVHIYNA